MTQLPDVPAHCLVTGAAGFIGSSLAGHLLATGHTVLGIDRFTDHYAGIAGQQVLAALAAHPWFQLEAVAASERSTGRTLRQALTDPQPGADRWFAEGAPPGESLDLTLVAPDELAHRSLDLIFSAVESEAAEALEPRLRRRGPRR